MIKRKGVMRILIVLLSVICICCFDNVQAAEVKKADNNVSVMYQHPAKEQMRKQFEQRLNLSEKQKEKARVIHKQGREEMRPIMMQITAKKQELEMLSLTKLSEKEQKQKADILNSEINALEKQAREIRKKNTQDFEKILNKNQRAELEMMKAEGRAKYERNHHARPPFQGLGTPSFLFKPLLPPPSHDNGLWK